MYVVDVRHTYRDAWALHGQLVMYVLKQYTQMIQHCLFYVYVNIIRIQMKFYNNDYIVVNELSLLSSLQLMCI